jgi:hypothetical protein
MEEQEHIGITEEYRDLYQLPQNKEEVQLGPRPTQLLLVLSPTPGTTM